MFKSHLGVLLRDSGHGGILKVLSLAARLLFFVLVVPVLFEGELATYVYVSSAALLLAMFLVLGLDEELPRIVAGNIGTARDFRVLFFIGSGLAMFTMAIFMLFANESELLAIVMFSLIVSSGRYLSGLVRGLDAATYERLVNVPWLLFIAAALVFNLRTGLQLIVAMSVCMLVTQWASMWISLSRAGHERAGTAINGIRLTAKSIRAGIPRLVSNFLLLGTVRCAVVLPVWFSMDVDLDQIAIVIAIGEIITQFGLIPVNRTYTRWVKSPPDDIRIWRNALAQSALLVLILSVTSIAGLFVAKWLGWLPPQLTDIHIMVQAIVYNSFVPVFWFLRYLPWALGRDDKRIVVISLALFLFSALVLWVVPYEFWFTFLSVVLVFACLAISWSSRELFVEYRGE